MLRIGMTESLSSVPIASSSSVSNVIPATATQQLSSSIADSSTSRLPPSKGAVAKSAKGRPSDDTDTRHSKTLSYLLRHGAVKEGLTQRPDGFIKVVDIMKRPKLKGLDLETLHRIVKENAKQRFTVRSEPTGDNGEFEEWIRANQGHSVAVESLELTQILKESELAGKGAVMVHGTFWRLWDLISKEGLKVMSRNHIHCAVGLAGDEGITSGMRSNCDLFIYMNVERMLQDGVPIFLSSNKVLLTPGNQKGVLETKYFSRVVRRLSKSGGTEDIIIPEGA